MDEKKYFVTGGEYADTTFSVIAPGRELENYGPFPEKQAHDVWRALTSKTVDNALVRYRLRPEEEEGEQKWHVVGGDYADTAFARMAPGARLESYGPYSRAEALAVWRAITAKTVDSATTRYDIVTRTELDEIRRTA